MIFMTFFNFEKDFFNSIYFIILISYIIITITSAQLNEYRVLLPETCDRVAIYAVAGTGKRVNIDDIQLLK